MKKIYYILIFLLAGATACLIAACSDDDEATSSSATVEIIENPVTGIILNNASDGVITLPDINANVTVQVSATPANADDAGNYVFISGDSKVFTVTQDGVITATGYGEATLSVVAQNNTAVSATCKVLVAGVRITAIEFNPSTLTITRTNATGPVTVLAPNVTITPAEASVKTLKYTSSHPEVAIISDDGDVWALWEGTTIIKAEALDGSGVSGSCTYTVNITPMTTITFNTLSFNAVSNTISGSPSSGTLHVNDVVNLVGTNQYEPGFTLSSATGTTANTIRYQPNTTTRNTFNFTSSNEQVITVTPTGTALVATPQKGVAGTATISIDAADGKGAHAELAIIMHKEIDRTNWTIADHSPDGTITSGSDEFGGPIDNVIKNEGAGGLVKSDTYNNSPQGITDSYFTIDLGAETTFDYFIISDAYCGSINSYVKTNRISLYGSHDGTSFSPVQETITKSVSTYGVPIRLNASHTYRYVKIVVWNTGTSAAYKNQSHYVIDNFRLAVGPQ